MRSRSPVRHERDAITGCHRVPDVVDGPVDEDALDDVQIQAELLGDLVGRRALIGHCDLDGRGQTLGLSGRVQETEHLDRHGALIWHVPQDTPSRQCWRTLRWGMREHTEELRHECF